MRSSMKKKEYCGCGERGRRNFWFNTERRPEEKSTPSVRVIGYEQSDLNERGRPAVLSLPQGRLACGEEARSSRKKFPAFEVAVGWS